ncbi:peptidase S8 and S53 subtilisin kexin sedolisin [[Leptolyngbya] sp. PCC 7376]|uniref:S8 family peptidase n=1 Tax=[Leptolyngbya] sp. PCC 7376 TaxID=111781 RepID=UPI00029EDC10|nr:PatA/PatG family cyanobactin maturation protease [[Leptolyngbya] sp. PCC 7376]AFY37276.1 peptidase S8 and S53 subtilisin kexin sedolisin [[Leptolyngbya] sp. PCC 7376]
MAQSDNRICIAVLDGPVDLKHPCFKGANLTALPSLVSGKTRSDGDMSKHGTHVASVIFGQPNTSVKGIAPYCHGLIVPVFADDRCSVSQLDLARGIETAVNAGANIINFSGGQLTDMGEAEGWLENAVRLCEEKNVLLVAAAGNDGCDCLHVPAALSNVLAVGAMDANGTPLDFSNWGDIYQNQGILAPGLDVLGASPGGSTDKLNGTSFATPIVSGTAALLLSEQVRNGEEPNPQRIRQILLQSVLPCGDDIPEGDRRCLAGRLNLSGAFTLLTGAKMSQELETITASSVEASCGCDGGLTSHPPDATTTVESEPEAITTPQQEILAPNEAIPASFASPPPINTSTPNNMTNQVTPSQAPSDLDQKQLAYALGTLGYDFGSEARRDTFKQLMPAYDIGGTMVPANPYDARQMVDYLANDISEARSLIWTLNIELTPVYAIEPKGPFAREAYIALQELLAGQIQAEDDENYIERVSIPGVLTGRTVKLFSGQVVPIIEPQSTRGLYGWKVNTLVNAALETVTASEGEADEEVMRRTLGSFLNRVYYDLRNLGTTSQDRALNFAVTNAFQAASTFSQAVAQGMELDSISVEKSPFCRMDSDCWDVKLKFFDPENSRRAKKIFRFTIDVSDMIPVTLGEVKSWSSPY